MNQIELEFLGYTWDEYFYVIANKSGILVAYRGGLDSEGAVKLDEVLYVDEADELGTIYESEQFADIRKRIRKNDRLFFSYADMSEGNRSEVAKRIKKLLKSEIPCENGQSNISYLLKGACALLPKRVVL